MRRYVIVAVGTVLSAMLGAMPPAVASAADAAPVVEEIAVVCTGSQTTTFTPGLRLFPQQVQVGFVNIYSGCSAGLDPAPVSSGETRTSVAGQRSCLDVPGTGPRTETITWNTGQTTTFTYSLIRVSEAGQTVVTGTGTVTSGLFQGRTVVMVIVTPNISLLQCALPEGVQSQGGPASITFV